MTPLPARMLGALSSTTNAVTLPDVGKVVSHNGGMAGHAALMYGTPDGARTLTAALNYVDDAALFMAPVFQRATQALVGEVFGADGLGGVTLSASAGG
ncbi:hypothetical protein [Streptomyces parvulus]|uniref:hypothetical protein n=1 Tax=Streptomyces parvulus TaxID=146923 RepID=UPI0036E43332